MTWPNTNYNNYGAQSYGPTTGPGQTNVPGQNGVPQYGVPMIPAAVQTDAFVQSDPMVQYVAATNPNWGANMWANNQIKTGTGGYSTQQMAVQAYSADAAWRAQQQQQVPQPGQTTQPGQPVSGVTTTENLVAQLNSGAKVTLTDADIAKIDFKKLIDTLGPDNIRNLRNLDCSQLSLVGKEKFNANFALNLTNNDIATKLGIDLAGANLSDNGTNIDANDYKVLKQIASICFSTADAPEMTRQFQWLQDRAGDFNVAGLKEFLGQNEPLGVLYDKKHPKT